MWHLTLIGRVLIQYDGIMMDTKLKIMIDTTCTCGMTWYDSVLSLYRIYHYLFLLCGSKSARFIVDLLLPELMRQHVAARYPFLLIVKGFGSRDARFLSFLSSLCFGWGSVRFVPNSENFMNVQQYWILEYLIIHLTTVIAILEYYWREYEWI